MDLSAMARMLVWVLWQDTKLGLCAFHEAAWGRDMTKPSEFDPDTGEYQVYSAHADVVVAYGAARHRWAVESIEGGIRRAEQLAYQAGRLSVLRGAREAGEHDDWGIEDCG